MLRSVTTGLPALLGVIRNNTVVLEPLDLYKVCALMKGNDDPLGIKNDTSFAASLHKQYKALDVDALNPFQKTMIEAVLAPCMTCDLPSVKTTATAVATSSSTPLAEQSEPTATERVQAIWEVVRDVQAAEGSMSLGQQQAIESHMHALEKLFRQLHPNEVVNLIKALAIVNYRQYQHVSILSRLGCEAAPHLSQKEVCKLYFNLNKLNTQDSLQAIVNKILSYVKVLSAEEVFLVAQALERQERTSPASTRMISSLIHQAIAELSNAPSSSYHRALLVSMSRYNLRDHHVANQILLDVGQMGKDLSERDLFPILQSAVDMDIPPSSACYPLLLALVSQVIPAMDARNVDYLMDIISMIPVDASEQMTLLMTWLEVDAGKLSIPQLARVVSMLSTYPPARGSVCIVSLAFAASLRSESIDGKLLETIITSLAVLGHFTDDFYAMADVLQSTKGGLRSFRSLMIVMDSFTREEVSSNKKAHSFLCHAVVSLAPGLNDAQSAQCKKALTKLGIADKQVHQRLTARLRSQGTHTGAKKKKYYDPMSDLIE